MGVPLIHSLGVLSPVPDFAATMGALPDQATIEAAITALVRRYPHGGNQLEAALRCAFVSGWAGRHDWQPTRSAG